MSTTTPSNLRWQLGQSQTPSTPHPMSAVPTSMAVHIDAAFDGEPRSAITPSSRKRRRHGPAVSSAWPSLNAPGAKPRGRPPASRNVQDGPFGTFPADPHNVKPRTQAPTSTTSMEATQARQTATDHSLPTEIPAQGEGRPGRLSLQVPAHKGGPVRLATPPALQLNGEAKALETRSDSDDPSREFPASAAPGAQTGSQSLASAQTTHREMPGFSFEALKRVLTSDLLRAEITGRQQRLSGEDAKRLADSVLGRLGVPRTDSNPEDDVARLSAATWLGVGDQANVPFKSAAGHGKRISVTRFRTDNDGYEEIIYADSTADGIREIFDLQWHASMGGCVGAFEMKGLSLAGAAASDETTETTHDLMLRKSIEAIHNLNRTGWVDDSMEEIARSTAASAATASRKSGGAGGNHSSGDENIDWKARCRAMEFAAHVAKGEVERARKRMLEKIIDVVL